MNKHITKALCALTAAAMLCGCGSSNTTSEESVPEPPVTGEVSVFTEALRCDAPTEGNDRVFYEIFVGSFSDSDGDGTGDIRGIIERFDYLNDGNPNSGYSLGVEGIWLSPIFKSPSYHKYDVQDYYAIDEDFGTEDDLKELIALCHERGVKLILDLPINHTSDRCEWFKAFTEARKTGDTDSEYHDFYSVGESVSADGKVFNAIRGTEQFYECNFSGDMPELDFNNAAVVQAVTDIAEHYLDMGVDGFRFDAAKYIFLGEEQKNIDFWNSYIGGLEAKYEGIFTVAEVWAHDSVSLPYTGATSCFNFTMAQLGGEIACAAKGGDVNVYTAYVENRLNELSANGDALLVPFITNHDMDRAAGFLTVASGEMKMAASLYLLLPGAPFIYYGEEIGMKGSRGSANTDANRRLAMLWGDGNTASDPEGATYGADKQNNGTVAAQLKDPDSLFSHYKKLIMIRKAFPEISGGEFTALRFDGTNLGGFVSTLGDSSVAVLHNSTAEPITVNLSQATELSFSEVAAAVGSGDASLDGSQLTLGAQTSVVLK